jgi:hypothetical protein
VRSWRPSRPDPPTSLASRCRCERNPNSFILHTFVLSLQLPTSSTYCYSVLRLHCRQVNRLRLFWTRSQHWNAANNYFSIQNPTMSKKPLALSLNFSSSTLKDKDGNGIENSPLSPKSPRLTSFLRSKKTEDFSQQPQQQRKTSTASTFTPEQGLPPLPLSPSLPSSTTFETSKSKSSLYTNNKASKSSGAVQASETIRPVADDKSERSEETSQNSIYNSKVHTESSSDVNDQKPSKWTLNVSALNDGGSRFLARSFMMSPLGCHPCTTEPGLARTTQRRLSKIAV